MDDDEFDPPLNMEAWLTLAGVFVFAAAGAVMDAHAHCPVDDLRFRGDPWFMPPPASPRPVRRSAAACAPPASAPCDKRRPLRIEPNIRHPPEPFLVEHPQLQPREMRADAAMRPRIEAHMRLVLAVEVERSGSGKSSGSRLAPGIISITRSPARSRTPANSASRVTVRAGVATANMRGTPRPPPGSARDPARSRSCSAMSVARWFIPKPIELATVSSPAANSSRQ